VEGAQVEDDSSGARKNMVYNPVSNEWMPRAQSELATTDDRAAAGGDGGDSNRYARRVEP
jgi:hypothetical protein